MTVGYYGWCPIHEWDIPDCTLGCVERKSALARLGQDLQTHWDARARGEQPLKGVYFGSSEGREVA